MDEQKTAIVVGVGAELGIGGAVCKRFAGEGYHVLIAGRTAEKINAVSSRIIASGGAARAVVTDTTKETEVIRLFDAAEQAGRLEVVVYNAGNNFLKDILDMEAEFFERVWRVGCFGGFLVGREAGRRMLPHGRGTLLFTGASGSLRGKPPFGSFAAAKAGLRALCQTMARDWGPKGIHVAHIIIDGGVNGDMIHARFPDYINTKGEDGMLNTDAIADAYWYLHTQHPTAWSLEIDLRPCKEPF